MRQHKWLELVKDYDCEILYHHEEANSVAGALSGKTAELSNLSFDKFEPPLRKDICLLGLELVTGKLAALQIRQSIFDKMAEAQRQDPTLDKYWKEIEERKETKFKVSDKGIVIFRGRICVLENENFKKQILYEAH
ncbi:uncharacterized protein LOC112094058 [Morus notabilis]|uniref:uncharacterized protein LOC112094058 n=1 Tax=Morus notabilis TaxID=981085 RepID=UPI000CED46D3|nr:uncharacterized protein LOC112094058 [Morus notabilis]